MDEQVIQCFATKFETKNRYVESQFQLRQDKKHIWLQKAAIWVLKKLQCFAIHYDVVTVKNVINADDFVQAFWKQHEELMRTYHYRGKRILIGYEEFQQMHGFPVNHPLSLAVNYQWFEIQPTREKPYNMHRTQCGLEITVIPWMKGILVLPEDLK